MDFYSAVTAAKNFATWAVPVGVSLILAWKAVAEWKRSNEQRETDLRWRQAEMAKSCLDELSPYARHALKMLDWDGRNYELTDKTLTQPIFHHTRRDSLRTQNPSFPPGDDGPFIRDAYDDLFDAFERFELFIRIRLIRFEDVAGVLRYYVSKMAQTEER